MMRGLWLVAMFSVMAGCTLHEPSKVPLPVDPPPRYQGDRVQELSHAPSGRWWLTFHDAELNRLMEELFQQNLELTQLIARLDQVESLIRITRSAQLPFISSDGIL